VYVWSVNLLQQRNAICCYAAAVLVSMHHQSAGAQSIVKQRWAAAETSAKALEAASVGSHANNAGCYAQDTQLAGRAVVHCLGLIWAA